MVKKQLILLPLLLLLVACNTTKFVPQGQYLLNDVKIKIQDTKDIPAADLMKYVQQKQNTEILGFWKLQLGIYNTAPTDTTKWVSKSARKLGEAPVVFSRDLTDASCAQLKRAMHNKGYFQAEVDDTLVFRKGREVNLTYRIFANKPYYIGKYQVALANDGLSGSLSEGEKTMLRIATNQRTMLVHDSMQYDAGVFDQERQRIARLMRRMGYYYFNYEFLYFDADSNQTSGYIDVTMRLLDEISNEERKKIFQQYKVAKVHFHLDYDSESFSKEQVISDSTKKGYVFSWASKQYIRENVLIRNCPIRPGDLYTEAIVERAYIKLNQLAPVKYVNITFDTVSAGELECHIHLSRNKYLNSVSTEIEGTYSAGDWGIAAGVGYVNRNLFRGAEEISVNGRASYEWRQNGGRAIEGKASAELKLPSAVSVNLDYNFQNRPNEYTRSIFAAGLKYNLPQQRIGINHQFRFLDISYVYLPWISDAFRDQFLQSTNILKYSYENHFIVGLGYSGNYTSYRARNPHRSYWNVYYNVETAGNLLRALSQPLQLLKDPESGSYTLFKTQFAQFAKADFSVTYNKMLLPNHRLVLHADLGLAVPYGNSQTIPFEKRYFSGGANSVRGWSARTLGPGGYKGNGKLIDFNNQSGDVRFNFNMEYRARVWSIFELAAFFDAGNIWTIFDYAAQPNGVFRFNEFYKQIALAYGIGVRLDLSFFIFRVDLGVKLYDPSLLYDGSDKQWRTIGNGLNWKNDMALHFAIGYPF